MSKLEYVVNAVKNQLPTFVLVAVVIAAIFGAQLYLIPRAPMNPITTVDLVFLVLYAVLGGAFAAALKERRSGPAVCKVSAGVGGFVGLLGMSCPFCSFFVLVWLGVPAGAGVGALPFLEPVLDIVRVLGLAVMAFGISLIPPK